MTSVRVLACLCFISCFWGSLSQACEDENDKCAVYASEGECRDPEWRDFMSEHCRRSCGFCQPRVWNFGYQGNGYQRNFGNQATIWNGQQSSDIDSYKACDDRGNKCVYYATEGVCSDPAWEDWMSDHCQNACRFCQRREGNGYQGQYRTQATIWNGQQDSDIDD